MLNMPVPIRSYWDVNLSEMTLIQISDHADVIFEALIKLQNREEESFAYDYIDVIHAFEEIAFELTKRKALPEPVAEWMIAHLLFKMMKVVSGTSWYDHQLLACLFPLLDMEIQESSFITNTQELKKFMSCIQYLFHFMFTHYSELEQLVQTGKGTKKSSFDLMNPDDTASAIRVLNNKK